MATDDEWDRIEGLLAARGWMSLNKNTTRILVAEDSEDGSLLAFSVLQMTPQIGPLWVRASARGKDIAETLADKTLEFLVTVPARGWFAIADSPVVKDLCEKRGMHELKSPVYIAGQEGG
jgi:hypothetical protein